MPILNKVINPANVHDGLERIVESEILTVGAAADKLNTREFFAVAYLDGKAHYPLRHEWDETILHENDIVFFVPRVAGLVSIVIAVIAVAAIAIALTSIIQPPNIADTPQPDPVFDLKGQKNQIRLGSPIEDGYGRVRMWPSYAARPYNQYYGNDQYQYQLFCLGHGSWDIEQIYIEDTPIGNFSEVEYEVYQPGESVTLFPDNVETSSEVGGIELFGPNEPDFATDPFAGPFAANSVNTVTNQLEVDVTLPKGLYFSNDSGGLSNRTITALFEYREIDNTGAPVGAGTWLTLASFNQTLATNTPQRYTFTKSVPNGRYEVRASRTNNKDESHRAGNDINWQAMRAFRPSTKDYGDVTMLAVKARATNNLNDQSANKVNVMATRKLPVWDAVAESMPAVDDYAARIATRSPIWAMVQILRASYGGRLADSFIDFETLVAEDTEAAAEGILFDWIYDQKTTVWEALKLPCFVNKAVPMLIGSKVSMVKDKPSTVPAFHIQAENTIEDTFSRSKKLFDLNPQDGLDVEYTDPTTWKTEVVKCLLGSELGNNAKRIKANGVTDRQRAFDLGMYLWSKESYERSQINLSTGLEGYYPTYGDLVRVSSDVPRWGVSGYVTEITGTNLTLSTVVQFTPGEVHKIALRGKYGDALGPYTVEESQTFTASSITSDGSLWTITALSHPFSVDDSVLIDSSTGDYNGTFKVVSVIDTNNFTVRMTEVFAADTGTVRNPFVVQSLAPIPTGGMGYDSDGNLSYFIFGISEVTDGKLCRVVNIAPGDDETIAFELVVDDQRRHADFGTAPPIDSVENPPVTPIAPVVTGVNVELLPDTINFVVASWNPALGATSYIVETSINGTDFTQEAIQTGTTIQLAVDPGQLWVRVAGVGAGVGPFDLWTGQVGIPTGVPADVQNLRVEPSFTGLTASIKWDQLGTADDYVVKIYTEDVTNTLILRDTVTVGVNQYDLDITQAQAIAADDRNITFTVVGQNSLGVSENEASVLASNTIPPALGTVTQTLLSDDGTTKTYKIEWPASFVTDLYVYRVWGSTTSGFTPSDATQIWQGLALETQVDVSSGGVTTHTTGQLGGTESNSTTAYATKGNFFTANVDMTITEVYCKNQFSGYNMNLGACTLTTDDAFAFCQNVTQESIVSDGNWQTVTLTTPLILTAGQHFYIYGTRTGGSVTDVNGLQFNNNNPPEDDYPQQPQNDWSFITGGRIEEVFINSGDGGFGEWSLNNSTWSVGFGYEKTTTGSDLYYRVAAVDVWESDDDVFNYSPEQTLSS